MSDKSFINELQRVLARPDVADLERQTRVYYDYAKNNFELESDLDRVDIDAVDDARFTDADKALAYIVLAAANYDDADYLAFIGAGLLEDILREPSNSLLERIVAEARKTPRFRWLLSVPYRNAISKEAWDAIEGFRLTGDHEEPSGETLPPRPFA